MRDCAGGFDDDTVASRTTRICVAGGSQARWPQRCFGERPRRLSVPYFTASRRVGIMSRTVFIFFPSASVVEQKFRLVEQCPLQVF